MRVGVISTPAHAVHSFGQCFVHGLGIVAATSGLQGVQHVLEALQVDW